MDATSFMLGTILASNNSSSSSSYEVTRLRSRVSELEGEVKRLKAASAVTVVQPATDEPWEGRWLQTNDGQVILMSLDAGLTEEQEWDFKMVIARARAHLWEVK